MRKPIEGPLEWMIIVAIVAILVSLGVSALRPHPKYVGELFCAWSYQRHVVKVVSESPLVVIDGDGRTIRAGANCTLELKP